MNKNNSTFYIIHYTFRNGFSLIELVVAITIVFLLSGIGIASYNSFNETQSLKQEALDLKNNLRLAQNKALSNEKICGQTACGGDENTCLESEPLTGWQVKFNLADYEIYGSCGSNIFSLKKYSLKSGLRFSYPAQGFILTFQALTAAVVNSSVICLNDSNKTYKLEVKPSGEIKDYGITTCP